MQTLLHALQAPVRYGPIQPEVGPAQMQNMEKAAAESRQSLPALEVRTASVGNGDVIRNCMVVK